MKFNDKNLFSNLQGIPYRIYDLKGCSVNRFTEDFTEQIIMQDELLKEGKFSQIKVVRGKDSDF